MKTFLWTSLFWIVAAIAGLLCLGFGNLGTQVLDNARLAKVMPKNVQTLACDYDSAITSAMEGMDWCAMAEANNCVLAVEPANNEGISQETAWLQEPLSSVIANQEIIYNYLQDSFAKINQSINELQTAYLSQTSEQSDADAREAQRLQLQAQIEALQNEMANL